MEGIGAEVSQKIRSAIKAKFKEIGLHVDEELPDYVMVMVANKRSKEQMDEELQLFLGKHTSLFTAWLHQVLQKLQEVTVAKLGGVKRKSLDESKKKKKSKQDKEIKKKIKEEPEDNHSPKAKENKSETKEQSVLSNERESQSQEVKSYKKQKSVSNTSPDQSKDIGTPNTKKQKGDSSDPSHDERHKKSEGENDGRGKSLSVSSQMEDLDDEDCINIRTDGELLDTAEDINVEDSLKRTREKEELNSKTKINKKDEQKSSRHSPTRNKDKARSSDHTLPDKTNANDKLSSPKKRSPTPPKTSPKTDDKVIDARELLNRKKAAKQADSKTRSRSRSRERDRSLSPVRKKKEEERESRNYREERGSHRKLREDEREPSRKYLREEERDRRGQRDRESHTVKRRDDWPRRLESDKIEQKNKERKRESSIEPPPKRLMLDRSFRKKNDDWGSGRTAKASEGRKIGAESPKRKDTEVSRRPGVVSRVVARAQEPEEDIQVPGSVPSVVKVTPRPTRPPSQQPSTSLIMRAISEANKSLANLPQRPDSTQEDASEAVSHSDAAKALNTVIRYVKQTDKTSADLKVFLKWRKKALSTLNDS